MSIDWNNILIIEIVGIGLLFSVSTYFLYQTSRYFYRRASFLLIAFVGLLLIALNPQLTKEENKTSQELNNDQDILAFLASERAAKSDTIRLKGSDYTPDMLELLDDYYLAHDFDTIHEGFTSVWLPNITENENWKLRGRVSAMKEGNIILKTANDEIIETGYNTDGSFEVISKAPSVGLYEYDLILRSSSGDSIVEHLPIQVKEEKKLNMLLIAESPSFELNYFKNYWSNLGHGLIQRVRIAKDKFSTTFINFPRRAVDKIDEDLLDDIDLLMFDQSTWNGIGTSTRNLIRRFSNERALAVIIRMNKLNTKLDNLPSISATSFSEETYFETELTAVKLQKGRTWRSFQEHAVLELGFGKFLVLGLDNTYKLILNDQGLQYQKHWADLISELYLEKQNAFEIEVPFPVYANEKTTINLINVGENSKFLLNDKEELEEMKIPLVSGFANSEVIALPGWNKIRDQSNNEERWFYAFDEGDWSKIKSERIKHFIENLTNNSKDKIQPTFTIRKSLPWWLFFLLPLIGFGLLWIDEKING